MVILDRLIPVWDWGSLVILLSKEGVINEWYHGFITVAVSDRWKGFQSFTQMILSTTSMNATADPTSAQCAIWFLRVWSSVEQ